jgi:hypothetical protein
MFVHFSKKIVEAFLITILRLSHWHNAIVEFATGALSCSFPVPFLRESLCLRAWLSLE